jgi:glycosyltransferase involved in cell wall biosynthesis
VVGRHPQPTVLEPDSHDEPTVDVGIPAYGRSAFLAEAIESVLAQTYPRWRLTISDDDGGPAAIVAPYLVDERVSFRHGPGAGGDRHAAAANWSSLVQAASAPYVALLHHDDWWEPGFLERRVAFLERHPECGFVYGPHIDVREDGSEIWRAPVAFGEGVHRPEEFVRRFVREAPVRPSPPSLLVTREAYETVGPRFDSRFVVFDSEMWLRIATRFPVGYLTRHDSYYRVHESQLSERSAWGEAWLHWQEHMEQHLDRELPAAAFTVPERRARRASALLSAALDAVCEGRRVEALRCLRRAAALERRGLLDPRLALTLLALPLGRHAAKLLHLVRRTVVRRGIRSRLALPH